MYDTMHINLSTKSVYLTEDGDFKVADWAYIEDKEHERYFRVREDGEKKDVCY